MLLAAASAQAALKFGTDERIRYVAPFSETGPRDEKLFLARKITTKSFLLPYTVRDDGYVLGVEGDSGRYYNIREGALPDLPPYALGTADLLVGHSLWLFLLAVALYAGYRHLRPGKSSPSAPVEAAAPAYTGPEIVLPMRLAPSRIRTIGLLAASLAFLVVALLMAREQPMLGYLGAAFCAATAVVFGVQLVPGASFLELTAEGFTFAGMFRKKSELWRDIRGFGVWRASRNKMVGWLYMPGHQVRGQSFSEAMTGVHGSLPDTYGMKAEDLADLMNELKRRAG